MTDVTDTLIAKLQARRGYGTEKYGQPLQPFDGRITELDIEEELLDALAYVTKMRMERAACAALLRKASIGRSNWESYGEILEMVDRLEADKWRIGGAQ